MYKNFLKTALQALRKHRIYSFINIAGLTVGLCACMLVATVVADDLSYDKQWTKGDIIYRIVSVNKMGEGLYDRFPSSFAGLAPELKKNFPEVETYAELSPGKLQLKLNNTDANGIKVSALIADTASWQMLDITVLQGNPEKFVEGVKNLVISESFKNKYFPHENPVGKILNDVPAYSDKPNEYMITGIIKDIPSNTHLRADVISFSKGRVEELNKMQYGTFSQNYILMKPGTDMKKFTAKVNSWYKKFITADNPYQYEFQPIKDIYLHSDFAQYQPVKGSIQNIYIFSGVAFLLLFIACINFINLSTARAATRLKETGVRKILGASRRQIIFQFLSEAVVFFCLSFIAAILLYAVFLPAVEKFAGHNLAKNIFSSWYLMVCSVAVILIISVFTGIYPAWLLSGIKPSNSLKQRFFQSHSSGQNWLRKSLVVLQFSISIAVLLAMIVVQQQLHFMQHADIGFNKNNLLSIGSVSWDGKAASFKNELMKLPGVESVSQSTGIPGTGAGYMSREVDDPQHAGNKMTVWYISGDAGLASTLGLTLQAGRFLSNNYGTDIMSDDSLQQMSKDAYNKIAETRGCIITQSTADLLHIKLNQPQAGIKATPVGIVNDFHNQSFREAQGPLVIIADASLDYSGMLIRVTPGASQQVMASVQKLWRQFYPSKYIEAGRVDEILAKQYEAESKLTQLFMFFSALTMALAALGILGLIVHTAQQRVKEIGVRKVLGASAASIVRLLSFDFMKPVLLAVFIASPVAWVAMNKWLQDFAYRINISWWMFALTGFIALSIALITVSFQAIKAAIANPVDSLRSE